MTHGHGAASDEAAPVFFCRVWRGFGFVGLLRELAEGASPFPTGWGDLRLAPGFARRLYFISRRRARLIMPSCMSFSSRRSLPAP